MAHPIPPYGVAIHDAIASGDVGQMQQVASDAESYLKEFGEIGDGLKKLRAEIARLGGGAGGGGGYGGIIPLYAAAMQEAVKSGDSGKMKEVAQQAEDYLKQADEVRSALDDLNKAIGS
jgi:dihydrodipicolinate synthase/N-acetylneuraminate lyase